MASVTVSPEEFKFVFFDGARISAVTEKLLGEIGLDRDVHIEVDESTPLGRARVSSVDPIVLSAESGAFEDAKRPRHLSERATADAVFERLWNGVGLTWADIDAACAETEPTRTPVG